MVLNRRLPGITARDVGSIVPFGDYSPHKVRQNYHALGCSREPPVFKNLRLCTGRDKYRCVTWVRSKAAPLQFGARHDQILLAPGSCLTQLIVRRGHHQSGQLADRVIIKRNRVGGCNFDEFF